MRGASSPQTQKAVESGVPLAAATTVVKPSVSVTPSTAPKATKTASKAVLGAKSAVAVGTGAPIKTRYVGVFVSSAPDDPASIAELDAVAKLGANIIYNYSAVYGSPVQV